MANAKTSSGEEAASMIIEAKIASLGDWRGSTFTQLRKLIRDADPEITEDVKWRKPSNPMGVPVWERAGLVCTGEVYKDKVKLTFAAGAALDDPAGLFNSSLDGNLRRAIDFGKDAAIEEPALTALIRAAVSLNLAKARK